MVNHSSGVIRKAGNCSRTADVDYAGIGKTGKSGGRGSCATAIYGSRGANGVILITTIRGDANAPKIVLSSNVGVSTIGKRYSMLKAGEYATLVNQIEGFTAYTPAEIAAFGQSQGTDWQNEVFSNGLTQNHNASISGGSGKVRYLFSGNYVSEVGTLENTNREKSSFRAEFSILVGPWTSLP